MTATFRGGAARMGYRGGGSGVRAVSQPPGALSVMFRGSGLRSGFVDHRCTYSRNAVFTIAVSMTICPTPSRRGRCILRYNLPHSTSGPRGAQPSLSHSLTSADTIPVTMSPTDELARNSRIPSEVPLPIWTPGDDTPSTTSTHPLAPRSPTLPDHVPLTFREPSDGPPVYTPAGEERAIVLLLVEAKSRKARKDYGRKEGSTNAEPLWEGELGNQEEAVRAFRGEGLEEGRAGSKKEWEGNRGRRRVAKGEGRGGVAVMGRGQGKELGRRVWEWDV